MALKALSFLAITAAVITWLVSLHSKANSTADELGEFKGDVKSEMVLIRSELKGIREDISANQRAVIDAVTKSKSNNVPH